MTTTREAQLEQALRNIAEGNLGDAPWQANYDRIRAVATATLSTPATEPQGYVVKPLVWTDAEYPNECWNAGDYDIWSEHGGFQVYHWPIETGDLHHDLKAAQDAAFTRHNARVQSFLVKIEAKL